MTAPDADAPGLSPMERGAKVALVRLKCLLPTRLRLDAGRRMILEKATESAISAGIPAIFSESFELPTGLQALHPSWLRHVLGQESLAVASALAKRLAEGGLEGTAGPWSQTAPAPLSAGMVRDLLWLLLGRLADLEPGRPAFPADASLLGASVGTRAVLWHRLPASVLWRALCERGAAEVGRSLQGAEPVMRARAMATVGEPWAQIVARFAKSTAEPPERDRARLAVARASGMAARGGAEDCGRPDAEVRLAFVGLAAARREVSAAGPAALRTIALRLPRVVGRFLLEGRLT